MSRVGDLILLNLLYIVTCIPIITIGAATTALYTVTFRFGTDREEGTVKSYLDAFRSNFKQATLLWLLMLFILLASFFNTFLFWLMPTDMRYTAVVFVILFLVAYFMCTFAFPLLSQFDSKNKLIFKNSLIMSLGYLPRTLLMAAMSMLPWILLLTDIILFLQLSFLWFMIYFALTAYINTKILHKVFAPYMTELEDFEQEGSI